MKCINQIYIQQAIKYLHFIVIITVILVTVKLIVLCMLIANEIRSSVCQVSEALFGNIQTSNIW